VPTIERLEYATTKKVSSGSTPYNRVEVKPEMKTSIVRMYTPEHNSSVQKSVVQLTKVSSAESGCLSRETEEAAEQDAEEDSPFTENAGEVVFMTDDFSSSDQCPGLLGPKAKEFTGKKCLVLDMDETLVHSSFKPVRDADIIVPVRIEGVVYKVYVRTRPFVNEFLLECAKHYEVVVFTASISKYANPLLDMLDADKVISHRLFRESCVYDGYAYVKDLTKLGRPLEEIIIVDNSPMAYALQPYNAIPITSWFDDRSDTELRELLPVLQTALKEISDVRVLLDSNQTFQWICAQRT